MKIPGILIIAAVTAGLSCSGTAKKNISEPENSESAIFSSYRAYDHFVKGDLYEQSGDYESAAAEYRKALIFDPESLEIRRALSEAYYRQHKFTEAAVARSEIKEKTVDDYNFIGDCLRFASDYSGAADFYKKSLEKDPTQLMTRTYLAGILSLLKDNKGAEKQYKAAIDYSADKVQAYMELASFYLRISENDKAKNAYDMALKEDPDDLRPAVGLGALYVADGDSVTADSIFNSLIEKNKDDVVTLNSLMPAFFSTDRIDVATRAAGIIARLAPDDADAQRRYSFLLFGNGQYADAESAFVSLEKRGMADASTIYYHARICQHDSNFVAAESLYNESLAVDDTLIDTWVNLAIVTDAQGKYKGALDVMQRALTAMPQDSLTIVFYTSLIHSRNDQFELARDGYKRLLASDPDNIDFHFNLGAVYEQMGNFDNAEKEFSWILDRSPNHALALNYLGYMYADRGIKLDKALDMIKKAVALDPENGAFLDSYAWVLYKMGKYDDALVQMKKALEYDNSDPVLFDHQGDIFAALNNHQQARQSWEKALLLDPENQEIQQKLNR